MGILGYTADYFPLDVLDEIWDLIESVSEGFLTYSYIICWLLSLERRCVELLGPLSNGAESLRKVVCSNPGLVIRPLKTFSGNKKR